jgi:phage portal protein BeeE
MRILGLPVPFHRRAAEVDEHGRAGSRRLVSASAESFAGAWQRNITIDRNLAMTFHAVFACETLIASDISKLRLKLVQQDAGGLVDGDDKPGL